MQKHVACGEAPADSLFDPTTKSEITHEIPSKRTESGSMKSGASSVRGELAPWEEEGWMPFVVTRIVPRTVGIEAEGKLFMSAQDDPISFRIVQASINAIVYRRQGEVWIGYSLVQNPGSVVSALNQCPVMLKKDPDLESLTLSTFGLSDDQQPEEIRVAVQGSR
jgi:hypothetical protein